MTSYYITVGYSSFTTEVETSKWLKENYENMDLKEIRKIAIDFGMYEDEVGEFLERLSIKDDLSIILKKNEDTGFYEIIQLASGGGVYRQLKEKMRKAVAAYFLKRSARDNVNINITTG